MTRAEVSRLAQTILIVTAMLVALALTSTPQGALTAQPATDEADAAMQARIEAVLERASDVPAESITVTVTEGVVKVKGSVVCAECGGTRTPGGTGTVQQSLGAVVRAIPGVTKVDFVLTYRQPE